MGASFIEEIRGWNTTKDQEERKGPPTYSRDLPLVKGDEPSQRRSREGKGHVGGEREREEGKYLSGLKKHLHGEEGG